MASLDLTKDVASERQVAVDEDGYHAAMARQRAQSKSNQQFTTLTSGTLDIDVETHFVGYEHMQADAEILLYSKMVSIPILQEVATIVVLDTTPCYGEGGGQVGDSGIMTSASGTFAIHDTQKQGGVFLHHGVMQTGQLACHSRVSVSVDASRQKMLNHSATHLLHAALRLILGACHSKRLIG